VKVSEGGKNKSVTPTPQMRQASLPDFSPAFLIRGIREIRGSIPFLRLLRFFAENQHKYMSMNNLHAKLNLSPSGPIRPNQA
jgi:hypothetical protein